MTIETAASTPIRVAVPSPGVLRLVNPFVSAILRSPFHRVLSRDLLLLMFWGRRSGKRFTIPVGYTSGGNTLTVFSTRSWWKNVRGASISVLLKGRLRTARAEPTDDRETVIAEVQRYVNRYGFRDAGRRIGLAFDPSRPFTHDQLAQGLPALAVIRLKLDPIPASEPRCRSGSGPK